MLISPKKALGIVLRRVRPLKVLPKPLAEATGYCLAEDVRADRDQPAADRSAMDGFAVRAADIAKCPCVLKLTGEVAAGSPARRSLRPGTCMRILTGANIPPDADAVVRLEQTTETKASVLFQNVVGAGANIRRQGEEAKKGKLLVKKGTVLGAAQIGLAGSVGKDKLRVYGRARVAVLCTGEELRSVSDRVRLYEIRDSNGPALCSALTGLGYGDVTHRVVGDNPKAVAAKVKRLADKHEVIIISGGVSVGKYDFVPEALKQIGASIHFHGVAIRPGKPQLYATLNKNRHIFGLPGNPLSVMVGFFEFVLPGLRRMSGLEPTRCQPSLHLPLAAEVQSKLNLVRFVLARLIWNKEQLSVAPLKSHGSADLVAAGPADGVIIIPAKAGKVSVGAVVEFRPWRPLP
ncbi:MAG: hypothetical protein GWP14_03085 [Actinobacteria bacterium]|nr:hypothetical protein [Actinomycetota bacterium]